MSVAAGRSAGGQGALLLRPATPDDARAIGELHHESWVCSYSALLPAAHWYQDTVERRVDTWSARLAAADRSCTLAWRNGQLAGFAAASEARSEDASRPLELSALYVRESRVRASRMRS